MKVLSLAVASLATTSVSSFVAPQGRFSVLSICDASSASTTAIASSMDEYERQLAAAYGSAAPQPAAPAVPQQQDPTQSFGAPPPPAQSFGAPPAPQSYDALPVAPPQQPVAAAAPAAPVAASAAAGGFDAFIAAQAADVDAIAATIGPDLVSNPEASWSGEQIAGCVATIDGREAPGANGNVAWLANTQVTGKLASLTIFNGPLTDVPHLLSQVSVTDDGKLRFTLDFRPRAYGAYEMRKPDGSYPGPDELGREAFTFSGNRNEFDTKFGTPEVTAFVAGIASSLQDAVPTSLQPGEVDQLIRGPLYLDETCAMTDANMQIIANARSQAAQYWLSWCMDDSHAHRPGAPINAQYVYDEKFRINSYQALREDYSNMFGATDGAKLAAADSGPLGEAYVGGGS